MRFLSVAVSIACALAACGSDDAPPASPDANPAPDAPPAPTARVVILSDTHVIGPQYTEPHESNPADNESILLSVQRLRAVRDHVNALEPRPDAVIVLGDVLHDAHHDQNVDWYMSNPSAFSVAKEIFDGFEMPVHLLMGNHDYEMGCDDETYPRALSEELFRRFFGAEPFYSVDYGGVRFHLLNGQQGRTWTPGDPRCDTDYASYGAEQLAWLDTSLDQGMPSVVMSHYMGLLWDRGETAVPGQEDAFNVIDAHRNVLMYLGGHGHRWVDMSSLFNHTHYMVGPSRYDDDNFWVLDIAGGVITIADKDKATWNTSCALTFDYAQTPVPVPGSVEMGTCVTGL